MHSRNVFQQPYALITLRVMAGLAVFEFLLEELPGFEHILNSTLRDVSNESNISALSECDPVLGDVIWNDINLKKTHSDKLKHKDDIESLLPDDVSANINIDTKSNNERNVGNLKKSTFLVAIFESVLNITAQTCGGTLVSPRWVLTAGTCVDLLSYLYKHNNSNTLDSHYTIIAKAIDPLLDGTVHNVSEIMFQPKNVNSNMITSPSDTLSGIKISSLALLRINPPVKEYFIEILTDRIKPGLEVDIYSWLLTKNTTTRQDTMTLTTFKAITLESNDCKVNYSFIEDTSLICLSAVNENNLETHLMNSGGPVVVSVENKSLMAAVAQLDSQSNLLGYSLYPHYSWIQEVINK